MRKKDQLTTHEKNQDVGAENYTVAPVWTGMAWSGGSRAAAVVVVGWVAGIWVTLPLPAFTLPLNLTHYLDSRTPGSLARLLTGVLTHSLPDCLPSGGVVKRERREPTHTVLTCYRSTELLSLKSI